MKNNFPEKTYNLFIDSYECWICGQNGRDCLHHIVGRDSDSPLNASPIHNFSCHLGNGKLATDKERGRLLRKTRQYLSDNDYQLTKEDETFIEKYKRLYDTY